jgi:hypothetical protein
VNSSVSLPAAFEAVTVKLYVPVVVGVPEITPVVVLRDRPAGNSPSDTLHVMGSVPVAARVCLYDVPTVPPGNDVVVILGGM